MAAAVEFANSKNKEKNDDSKTMEKPSEKDTCIVSADISFGSDSYVIRKRTGLDNPVERWKS